MMIRVIIVVVVVITVDVYKQYICESVLFIYLFYAFSSLGILKFI